jgi:hypothetical protein
MERREFLVGLGIALAAPVVLTFNSGCSNSSTSSTPTDGFNVDSSSSYGPGGLPHSHTLTILLADLVNPPVAGVSYVTGTSEGHSHQIAISRSDLADIQEGKTRTESTTVVLGHEHTFTMRKP